MLHRVLLDPIPPADADVDTAAMAETTDSIERGERHLRMLAELSEIGMRLARSLSELVDARVERELKSEDAPGRSEDAAAFDKMAQTVRRTAALEARLAEGVKVRREGLIAQRTEGRAASEAAHVTAVGEAIIEGLHDAYAATCPDEEYNDLADRLLDDATNISATPTKCAAISIARSARRWPACAPPWAWTRKPASRTAKPGASAARRGISNCAWRERARKYPPSPSWGGTDREAIRVGLSPESPNSLDNPTQPHPGCFASCPSP